MRIPPRRLLAALAVLAAVVVVVVAVDRLVVARAERTAARVVGEQLDAVVDVAVVGVLPGWQLLLADRLPRMRLRATDVPLPQAGVVVDELSVVVRDVRLAGDGRPVAGSGRFVATFGEAQVRAAAPETIAELLRVDDDGLAVDLGLATVPLQVTVVGEGLRIGVRGEVPLVGEALDELLGEAATVPLAVPDGVVVHDARVEQGRLTLSGTVDPVAVSRRR